MRSIRLSLVVFNEQDAHGGPRNNETWRTKGMHLRGFRQFHGPPPPRPCKPHGVTFKSYQWCCEELMRMSLG